MSKIARWGAVAALSIILSGCGGGGGRPSPGPGPGPGPTPGTVTVSGKITFDRVPFDATRGSGLNPDAPVESPARGVVVEALSGTAVVASTVTNATGDYSLEVPANTQLTIQAKAQMLKSGAAPTWNFSVLNNTNSDALYVLVGSVFNSGTTNSTRNLRAATGWNGTSYGDERPAAPFAILDTMYRAKELILSASASAAFPALNIYWSSSNKPTLGRFCIDDGDIGVTFYSTGGQDDEECDGFVPEGMYVLGDFTQGDTDEFDQHVLAHEFGHYVEAKFSRSDSIGGEHGEGDKLDLRVAFGEGFGNAFAGMVLNDPVYRDSQGGASSEFYFNMETDDTVFGEGWYSETSVGEILWDVFDTTNESGDSVTVPFPQIFTALVGGQKTTEALTSIYSMLATLQSEVPAQSTAISQLRNAEQIGGTNAFGANESNDGGDPSVLPIYRTLVLNQPQQIVCVSSANGTDNKLGYNKFFRLDLSSSASITINVTGSVDPGMPSQAASDPDIFVYRRGAVVASGTGTGAAESAATPANQPLAAGTYIVEIYDFDLGGVAALPRCMTISATGA